MAAGQMILLYISAVDRVLSIVGEKPVLFVGDCTLGALATRAYIVMKGQHDLCPAAMTGLTAESMRLWIEVGVSGVKRLEPVYAPDATGEKPRIVAEGFVFERPIETQRGEVSVSWMERVIVVRTESYPKSQEETLERLVRAFQGITRTVIRIAGQVMMYVTPLTPLQ